MKRWVLSLMLVWAGGAAGQEVGRGDEHRFQGEWELLDMAHDGNSILGGGQGTWKWVVQGGKVSPYLRDKLQPPLWDLRLDEAKQPKQLLLTKFWGSNDSRGLYRLDRDNITIYMDYASQGRVVPASADAKGLLVITLRRPAPR
jgi:uncharacterized protein (TIGR03067 family)